MKIDLPILESELLRRERKLYRKGMIQASLAVQAVRYSIESATPRSKKRSAKPEKD